MLNNLSYIHHFVGIFEKNQHSFHDDNNNELLDAIIFFRILFKVKVFVYILHNIGKNRAILQKLVCHQCIAHKNDGISSEAYK